MGVGEHLGLLPKSGWWAPKPVGEWTLRRLECGDAWAVLNWVTLKTVPGALASQRRECENQGIRRRKVQRCPELSSFPVLQWRLRTSDGHEQFDLVRRHGQAGKVQVCVVQEGKGGQTFHFHQILCSGTVRDGGDGGCGLEQESPASGI